MVTHLLFANDISLMSNEHTNMQITLNKLKIYAARKPLIVNTQI